MSLSLALMVSFIIIFCLTNSATIVSLKSLSTSVTTFSETYQYIASISERLHLMFLMLSIAETIIGVNEASPSGQGFSSFLLQVLSLPFKLEETFHCDVLCYYLKSLMVLHQLLFLPFEVTD